MTERRSEADLAAMRHSFARPGLLAALVGLSPAAQAATVAPPASQGASQGASSAAATAPSAPASDAERFCRNVAAAAADARFALQTRKLNELQEAVAGRVAALETKEAEVKALLDAHEEARKRAEASLVAIYAKMRPDAAAGQISALDDGTAAAVLRGLNARQSSAILNEIPADRAVKLVGTIAGLVPPPAPPPPPPPAPEEGRS